MPPIASNDGIRLRRLPAAPILLSGCSRVLVLFFPERRLDDKHDEDDPILADFVRLLDGVFFVPSRRDVLAFDRFRLDADLNSDDDDDDDAGERRRRERVKLDFPGVTLDDLASP